MTRIHRFAWVFAIILFLFAGCAGIEESAFEFSKEAPAAEEAGGTEGVRKSEAASRSDEEMFAEEASAPVSESGLTAGYADDNAQFGRFIDFLDTYGASVPHIPLDIRERISLRLLDSGGKPVAGASVRVYPEDSGALIERGVTYADGGFRFYPSAHPETAEVRSFRAVFSDPATGATAETVFDRDGERALSLSLGAARVVPDPVPLDIVFILDTTGSMGEEIERLKATIGLIHLNLTAIRPRPDIRFGLVLYKDRGDSYVTSVFPLTGDLDRFQRALNTVTAEGGGDGPEDLQEALRAAVAGQEIAWRGRGIQLAFVITDAEAHLDYLDQHYTYIDAAADARKAGIKLYGVGTGGLPLAGEIILRQIAHYTDGKYIFLTYGERGESEGGAAGSVSHHTGANFATDKLEAIIIRFAREELAYLSGKALDPVNPYFSAAKVEGESREETLGTLFGKSLEELEAYSSLLIAAGTATAVLPIAPAEGANAATAEYFTEHLLLTAGKSGTFSVVERKDLQLVLDEQNLQLSGLTEGEEAAAIGRLLDARLLISGKLFSREGGYELFLKLLRVETGEILSVTRAVIDPRLGL